MYLLKICNTYNVTMKEPSYISDVITYDFVMIFWKNWTFSIKMSKNYLFLLNNDPSCEYKQIHLVNFFCKVCSFPRISYAKQKYFYIDDHSQMPTYHFITKANISLYEDPNFLANLILSCIPTICYIKYVIVLLFYCTSWISI